jgi:hypothetical protein
VVESVCLFWQRISGHEKISAVDLYAIYFTSLNPSGNCSLANLLPSGEGLYLILLTSSTDYLGWPIVGHLFRSVFLSPDSSYK